MDKDNYNSAETGVVMSVIFCNLNFLPEHKELTNQTVVMICK